LADEQVFLTIPAIIYLTMTPRFPRTRKFANPYAMATVDCLFCIIWLSAFATVANFNSSGKCGDGCGKSKAVVGLGVFLWFVPLSSPTFKKNILTRRPRFLWIATSLISLYSVVYYKREGYMPGGSRAPTNAQMIDPDKEAFSTAPHDDEYAPVHHDEHDEAGPSGAYGAAAGHHEEDRYDGYGGSGGYVPPTVHDEPTGYAGAHDAAYGDGASGYGGSQPGRAKFPSAPYSNV